MAEVALHFDPVYIAPAPATGRESADRVVARAFSHLTRYFIAK
jgi:hypothetical protein